MTSRDGAAPRRLRVGRPRATLALFASVALAAIVPTTAQAGWQTGNLHPPVFRVVDELSPGVDKVCRDGFVWEVADRAHKLKKVFVVPLDADDQPVANARLTSPETLKLNSKPITIPRGEVPALDEQYYDGGPTVETQVFNAPYRLSHEFKFRHKRPELTTKVAISFLRDKNDPANAGVPPEQLQDRTPPYTVQDCRLSSDT